MSTQTSNTMSVQNRTLLLIMIVALYFVIDFLPTPDGLTIEGKRAIALMLCTVLAWITNVLPMMLSAVLSLMLMVFVGLTTLPNACDMFCEPIFFMAIANYVIVNGLSVTGLDTRIALKITSAAKGDAKKLLFIFMMTAAILSMFLADLNVVLMMFPIALMLLNATGCKPGESNYGRALMIGLPIAAYIGGMGTPVGASVNLMAMQLLESTAGIKITFTQWACLGIPVVLILTPIAFLIVWYIYKPELKTLKGTENVDERLNALGALGKQEKKYIVFITITLLLWMTESFHGINMAIVSAVAAIVLFLPGINILTWENTKNFI